MKEYLVMVGLESYGYSGDEILDTGGSNTGMVAYNENLLEQNSCFRGLVESFYLDLAKIDLKKTNQRPIFRSYVDLNSLIQTTENTGIPSGWLWEFALKKAKGDPNLAMSLINICGHDNTEQLISRKTSSTCSWSSGQTLCEESIIEGRKLIVDPNKRSEFLKYTQAHRKKIIDLWQPNTEAEKSLKKTLQEDKDDYESDCPSIFSSMYTQGALGQETLLPQELVNEIANIQAPNLGAGVLPSKYYHTIGAASMACSLVRKGVPGMFIRRIQAALINTYRMTRLCKIHHYNDQMPPGLNLEGLMQKMSSMRADKTVCVEREEKYGEEIYFIFKSEDNECAFLEDFQELIFDKDADENILRNKFQRRMAELHASKLYIENISPIRDCQKVQLGNSNIDKIKKVAESNKPCPGITAEECQRAKDVLKTWWVDFAWSEAQHLKGAEFAINNCKREDDFLESGLERKSCAALEGSQGGSTTNSSVSEDEGTL